MTCIPKQEAREGGREGGRVRGSESFIRKFSITAGLGGLPRTGSASPYSTACQSVLPRLSPDSDKRLAGCTVESVRE